MVLSLQTPSKHNQMITRFIKHPKSTNFDGEKDIPPHPKRQRTGDSPRKAPPTPRKIARREVPDSDAEDDEDEVEAHNVGDQKEHKTDLESALPAVQVDEEALEAYEAFKASQEENDNVEDRLEKRAWVRGKSSLYVDAFNLALETVLDEESHLFDEAEREVFELWRGLGYEAQYL